MTDPDDVATSLALSEIDGLIERWKDVLDLLEERGD